MKANLRAVDNEKPHARDLARQKVKAWRSNAQIQKLPTVNVRDDKGASVLNVDEILQWNPKHIGRK